MHGARTFCRGGRIGSCSYSFYFHQKGVIALLATSLSPISFQLAGCEDNLIHFNEGSAHFVLFFFSSSFLEYLLVLLRYINKAIYYEIPTFVGMTPFIYTTQEPKNYLPKRMVTQFVKEQWHRVYSCYTSCPLSISFCIATSSTTKKPAAGAGRWTLEKIHTYSIPQARLKIKQKIYIKYVLF